MGYTAPHQRASGLLASESASRFLCERNANYVKIHEYQTKPNPALAAVQGPVPLLLN